MDATNPGRSTSERTNAVILVVSVAIGYAVGVHGIGGVWGWILAVVIVNVLSFGAQAVLRVVRRTSALVVQERQGDDENAE